MVEAARDGRLSEPAMIAWNRGVWLLQDLELKLVANLSRLGAEGPEGQPLAEYATADQIQSRRTVGYFATGTPPYAGAFGDPLTLAVLATWFAVAIGLALAAAFVAWVASKAVENFGRAEIDEASAKIEESIAMAIDEGRITPEQAAEALAALAALERERRLHDEPKTPAWAKGIAVAGGAVAGLALAWAVSRRIGESKARNLAGTPDEHRHVAGEYLYMAAVNIDAAKGLRRGSCERRRQLAMRHIEIAAENANWAADSSLLRRAAALRAQARAACA